jgi:hypothetical protein
MQTRIFKPLLLTEIATTAKAKPASINDAEINHAKKGVVGGFEERVATKDTKHTKEITEI